jgi:hypothetical protein
MGKNITTVGLGGEMNPNTSESRDCILYLTAGIMAQREVHVQSEQASYNKPDHC